MARGDWLKAISIAEKKVRTSELSLSPYIDSNSG